MTIASTLSFLQDNAGAITTGTINSSGPPITLSIAGSEKVRVDSNGYLLVNYNSSQGSYALQVQGSVYFSGNLTVANIIAGSVSGSVSTATNVASGSAGNLVYQISSGNTGFLPTGAAGTVLIGTGSAPSFSTGVTLTNAILTGQTVSTSTATGALTVSGAGGVGIGGNLNVGGNTNITGITTITNVTANSDNTTTGALQVAGGVGIGGNLRVGGTIRGAFSPRLTVVTDGTSISFSCDNTDLVTHANAQGVGGTLTINAPTGTPYSGQKIIIRIRSTNAQILSFNTIYAASSDVTFPSATSGSSKFDYLGFIYNDTSGIAKWQLIAKVLGF
jgi:hypothetical protein